MSSDADDAAFLASAYGLTPDPWQADVLDDWMGRRRDGKWAASKCGLAVPRQNGKNGIIEVRELFGMVELGEKFLHTAHEVKTARKAFLRISSFFENPRKYPELAELVKDIRKTNGQEAVLLENGGSVEFVARSSGSGRGFTVDVLVLDEAQALKDEQLEALKPTISAAPLGNPQTIYTGTPPDPDKGQSGEVFARIRAGAEDPRRLAWTDFGVPDGPLPDLDDRDLWFATNPALGGRLHLDVLLDERDEMSPEGFARERLGWWGLGDGAHSGPISPQAWRDATDADRSHAPERMTALAVEVDLDGAWASIGAAGYRADRKVHLEVVRRDRGTRWIVPALVELNRRIGPIRVGVDGGGPAAPFIPLLEEARLDVVTLGTADVAEGCAGLVYAVTAETGCEITHGPDPLLDAAVVGAKKRPFRDGGYAFARVKSDVDITPLMAVTLARWVLLDGPQYARVAFASDLIPQQPETDSDDPERPAVSEDGVLVPGPRIKVLTQDDTTTLRVPPRR